jgi:hypothetical protein
MIIYFVFPTFFSRPTSLRAPKRVCWFYGIYIIAQQINIISIDQWQMCPIQFQTDLISLDFLDGIFLGKKEQWRYSISLFQAIRSGKCVRQMFTYMDFAIDFI